MADASTTTATNQVDPLVNLKAEMDRKFSGLNETNKALLQQLAQVNEAIKKSTAPQKPAAKEDDLESLVYDNPKLYAQKIKENAKAEMREELQNMGAHQQRQNATLATLVKDFPELNDEAHELTKKAVEIYSSFSDEDKKSPVAYRAAVKEAALEVGIKPYSKRSESEIDAHSASSRSSSRSERRREEALDPKTIDFAKMVGLNTDDPALIARIKARAKRQTWNKYE